MLGSQARRVQHDFDVATTPLSTWPWARFGRSFIVPPIRVERPELVEIGDGVVILENCWMSVMAPFDDITTRLVIEDDVRVGRGCQFSVAGRLVVGKGALIGDFVQIGDTYHDYEAADWRVTTSRPREVVIGPGAVVAGHAIVTPGVTVGAGAVVDHHAVVVADVAPSTRVSGNPARLVR